VTSWVLFKDSGTESTSTLIGYFDTKSDASALSYTPNGSNLTLSFQASGIFSI
jgi:hypothetical protein